MSVFSTMIVYGVKVKTEVSNHQYDIGVKGQGQIYLSVLWLVMRTPLTIFDGVCS